MPNEKMVTFMLYAFYRSQEIYVLNKKKKSYGLCGSAAWAPSRAPKGY